MGGDREGESSQGQSGEAAVIWVTLLRNEKNVCLSPIALLIGEEKNWGIQIELTLFG